MNAAVYYGLSKVLAHGHQRETKRLCLGNTRDSRDRDRLQRLGDPPTVGSRFSPACSSRGHEALISIRHSALRTPHFRMSLLTPAATNFKPASESLAGADESPALP